MAHAKLTLPITVISTQLKIGTLCMSLNFMNKAQIESYNKLPLSLKYFIGICLFYLVYAFLVLHKLLAR